MKKVLIKGPAFSQSGYGEQARFALRALRKFPDVFDLYLSPTPWGKTGWIWEDNEERKWMDGLVYKTINFAQQGGQFDISLQITIPPEWEGLAPVNIGYTAGIETTKMDSSWMQPCSAMNKIITVSEHAAFAIRETEYIARNNKTGEEGIFKVETPVDVVNYPVRRPEAEPLEIDFETDFNFLVVALWGPRKNIEQTIKGFVEEYYDREDVGLVLKIAAVKGCLMDRNMTNGRLEILLNEYKGRKCKVYLLHGDLTSGQMVSLYRHPKIKALVNLAHGEGFGLPMFEAVCEGLPVIAPAWGGQSDFIFMNRRRKVKKGKKTKFVDKRECMIADVSFDIQPVQKEALWQNMIIPEAKWCFPKEWRYKSRLRELEKNHVEWKHKAEKLQKYVLEEFEETKMFTKFAEAVLGEPIQSVANISTDDIPKISLITSVYDGDEYLEEFLENITSQTIWDKCELVMIDGASPGNEAETIKKWQEKYPNQIVYKRFEEDPGIYGCWNEGIKLATGEFISNANLDDRKRKDSLERHAKELVANPDVDLVYADSYITKEGGKKFEDMKAGDSAYNFEQFSLEAMLRGNQPHNNPMWRRTLHDNHGMFDPEFKSAGDWEFFCRCAFGGAKFQKINDVLGLYYFNPKGMSTNPKNKNWKKKEEMKIFKKYQGEFLKLRKQAA